jgi:membrane associated rhomboid family serine protease
MGGTPILTYAILAVTVFISYRGFSDHNLQWRFMFNAHQVKEDKEYYRLLSHGFIHSGWPHLIMNMIGVYFFGPILEMALIQSKGFALGGSLYLLLYFGAMIVGSLPALYKHHDNPGYNALGASGAVYGIVMAFVMLFPVEKIDLYAVIGMPAYAMGALFFVVENYSAKKNNTNIGHDAHITGALFGVLFVILIYPGSVQNFFTQIMNNPWPA